MRVVVMDEDMHEPITVVEIPAHLMRDMSKGARQIRLPAPVTGNAWGAMLDKIPNLESWEIRVVTLRMEPIYKGQEILYWVAIPDQPELALLLRAAFLPGQVTEMRRREAVAWFNGALATLR